MSRLVFALSDLRAEIADLLNGPMTIREMTLVLADDDYDAVAREISNHFGHTSGVGGTFEVDGVTIKKQEKA